MRLLRSQVYFSLAVIVVLAALVGVHHFAAAQPAQPATQPAGRSEGEVVQSVQQTSRKLGQLIGDESALADPAKRTAIAAEAIPLVHQLLADYADFIVLRPEVKENIDRSKLQLLALASALGDKPSADQLDAMAASKEPADAMAGRMGQLQTQWILAGKDAAAQAKVIDTLQALAEAHTDSIPLTIFAAQLAQSEIAPAAKERLVKLATETMKNAATDEVKAMLDMDAASKRLKESLNKPFAVSGKTVGGTAFTTADWKGKVVVVDFWATWCGPCVEALPHLQQLYADNHAKGLEVVGVSNDYAADTLTAFTTEHQMPWPQLFDAAAGAQQQWNPITFSFGIDSIPTILLIDRKGMLRSIHANEEIDTLLPKLMSE